MSQVLVQRLIDPSAPKLESEHMTSVPIERKPKTWVYSIISNHGGARLGVVKWFPRWRGYAFEPEWPTVFSDGCLYTIFQFIRALKDERRKT